MFGFLKRKVRDVYAPVDGNIVKLESVNDDVFSTKMVGDGVAIIPITGHFTAPIDGVVSKIFSTNHAYSIKSDKDLEIMVHIGLETVSLDGKGFTRIAQEGENVKAGDVIIEADLSYIQTHAKDIITPIIVTDASDVKEIDKNFSVVKSQDKIMEVS
ncbi:MAG: PTS system, glucose-specific IIA component [uncultured Sulfurovum sp.]|uniref:PTS system glucose-specific EIIA component n=1 Tax=uncultured Sulfurovum sp. TaxID=269237 RepID=A0A6S6T9V3_9BACT|nr:MAG: PTS system, glucose-specific IIA component [uncultured Sulfurovum sp.]